MGKLDYNLLITGAGVVVALFIGGMQVYIAHEQKKTADRQASIAEMQGRLLALQGDVQAVSSWLPFLTAGDPDVRYAAVIALERIHSQAVIAPLVTALGDDVPAVRRRAAEALGGLATGDNRAEVVEIAVSLLEGEDRKTIDAAIQTLVEIGFDGLPQIQQALAVAPAQARAYGAEAIQRILLNERVMTKIGALASHELTAGSPDVLVALVGAGVDRSLPDIADALTAEVDHARGGGAPGPSTTMAARLIVGHPDSEVVGVAPGVRLLSERVMDPHRGGRMSDIVNGIRHAVEAGARVIYLEVGSAPGAAEDQYRAVQVAVDEAHAAGCVVVAAAGNLGTQPGMGEAPVYPAALDRVIAVAATDLDDRKADYSSFGPWVDISAPGNPLGGPEAEGSPLSNLRGTSFAGSLVAGAAALVLSANPSLAAAQVEDVLESTADDIDRRNEAYRGKLGAGRLNVLAAVRRAVEMREARATAVAR